MTYVFFFFFLSVEYLCLFCPQYYCDSMFVIGYDDDDDGDDGASAPAWAQQKTEV